MNATHDRDEENGACHVEEKQQHYAPQNQHRRHPKAALGQLYPTQQKHANHHHHNNPHPHHHHNGGGPAGESKGYVASSSSSSSSSVRRSHDGAHVYRGGGGGGGLYTRPTATSGKDQFTFELTAEDEEITRRTAVAAYENQARCAIDLQLAESLTLSSMVHQNALSRNAEELRARAIATWLTTKSPAEQLAYKALHQQQSAPAVPQPPPPPPSLPPAPL